MLLIIDKLFHETSFCYFLAILYTDVIFRMEDMHYNTGTFVGSVFPECNSRLTNFVLYFVSKKNIGGRNLNKMYDGMVNKLIYRVYIYIYIYMYMLATPVASLRFICLFLLLLSPELWDKHLSEIFLFCSLTQS